MTERFKREVVNKVIDSDQGYIVVRNLLGEYIVYYDGDFSMKYRGMTKLVYKTKRTAKEIFLKRIKRHTNFEHDGKCYYWNNRGKWMCKPQEFNFD
ncbi:MAG: hypothetical protein AAGH46_13455 [Bacteroidota bacterium]